MVFHNREQKPAGKLTETVRKDIEQTYEDKGKKVDLLGEPGDQDKVERLDQTDTE